MKGKFIKNMIYLKKPAVYAQSAFTSKKEADKEVIKTIEKVFGKFSWNIQIC